MGRKARVTAEQTRRELLEAGARVFALKGYDGASIADITSEADLSSGSIYAHYGSKAELFVAVVREHAQKEFAELVGVGPDVEFADIPTAAPDITDFVSRAGASYASRQPFDAPLMIEAIVAAKRHPEIEELVKTWLVDGEAIFADAVALGQAAGLVDDGLSSTAVSRFITMMALGARVTNALDLPGIERDEWSTLIDRLVDAIRHPSGS
jgi:AcrR family transcriptional regulator